MILQVDGDSIAHNMGTANTSSAATALPTLKNGDPAKYVHCSVEAATVTPIGWIRFGIGCHRDTRLGLGLGLHPGDSLRNF